MPIDRRKPDFSAQFQTRPSVVERRPTFGGPFADGWGSNPSINFNNGSSRAGTSTIKITPKTSKQASSRGLSDQKSYEIQRQQSGSRSAVDNRSSRALDNKSRTTINLDNRSSRALDNKSSKAINLDNRSSRAVNPQHAKPYNISVFPPTLPRPSIHVGACVQEDRSGQLYRINRNLEHNYNPDFHNFRPENPCCNPCCPPVFDMRSVFSPSRPHGGTSGRCGLYPGESVQLQVLGDLHDVGISRVNCNLGSVDVLKDRRTLLTMPPPPAARRVPNIAECCCPRNGILKSRQQQQQQQQQQQRSHNNVNRQQCEYVCQPLQCRDEPQDIEEDIQMRLFFGCVRHFLNYSAYIGVFLTVFTAIVWYMCINSLGRYSVIFGMVLMSFLLAFRAKRLFQFLER